MMKNKKANLPVTVLVIGIFALCGFALLTFFLSDFKISNSFVGIDVVSKLNSLGDEYLFLKNAGVDEAKLATMFDVKEEYGRKYFYEEKLSKGGIWFFGGRETLLVSVQYQIPS